MPSNYFHVFDAHSPPMSRIMKAQFASRLVEKDVVPAVVMRQWSDCLVMASVMQSKMIQDVLNCRVLRWLCTRQPSKSNHHAVPPSTTCRLQEYLCLCEGAPIVDSGEIHAPLLQQSCLVETL